MKASRSKTPSSTTVPNSGSAKTIHENGKVTPISAGKKSRKKLLPKAERSTSNVEVAGDHTKLTSSMIRGVTMRPSGKWQAQLYFAGQSRYIGVFDSREKATQAYEIAREILKGRNTPSAPGEMAEKAVEAARKAAFEGVKRGHRLYESPLLTAPSDHHPTTITTPSISTTHMSPPTGKSQTPSTKTPSTNGSSTQSDGRSSMRALKAAEILKAIGMTIEASADKNGIYSQCCGDEILGECIGMQIEQGSPKSEAEPRQMPDWVDSNSYGEELCIAEWELMDYREANGWKGRDLLHDDDAPVRIHQYFVKYGNGIGDLERGGEGTTLTGIVHFTPKAESHRGFCHGGSMTSVMDDVVGWVAFLASGSCQPWTGYTVQINTSLKQPIPVDSWLLVSGTITKIEGRKVSVTGLLVDPANENVVHAQVEGLVILNRGVLPSRED